MSSERTPPFFLVMDRAMRRIRQMPYRTQPERQARADELINAMAEWRRLREDARRRASERAG